MLFTSQFFFIKYPIREFRTVLGSIKFLYGLTLTGFVFLKVLISIYLFRKFKVKNFNKFFVIIFVFYILIFFSIWEYFQSSRGDEIEYYINLNSIINDFDFNVYNDVLYREIICNTTTLPVFIILKDKLYITQHSSSILLFFIFVLPYYFLKRFGVILLLNFLFSITFYQIFKYFQIYIKEKYLLFLMLLFPGFLIYSTKLYPEIFPVFFLFYFANKDLKIIEKKPFLYGIINSLMILLNIRYLIISFSLGLVYFLKIKPKYKKFLFLIPIIITLLIYLLLNHKIYGNFSLAANTKGNELEHFQFNNIRTFNSIIFDQEFGLFIYNPVLLLVILTLFNIRKLLNFSIIFSPAAIYFLTLTFYGINWWGGISPPFRLSFLIIIIYYAIFIYIFDNLKSHNFFSILVWTLIFVTILISFIMISFPIFQYNERLNGKNQILEKVKWYFHLDFTSYFPSYIKNKDINYTKFWYCIIILFNCAAFILIKLKLLRKIKKK